MLKDYIIECYEGFTKLQRSYKGDWIMESVPHLQSGIHFFCGPWAAKYCESGYFETGHALSLQDISRPSRLPGTIDY